MATDESPPKQPRFGGLRFQITVLYIGTYKSLADWETSEGPPILRTSILGTSRIAQERKAKMCGVASNDYPSGWSSAPTMLSHGVGDGGGENEGETGVYHSFEEEESGGYVRRRCLPHIAWRTADQAINQALSLSDLNYRGINT